MQPRQPPRLDYNPALDGLRALAVGAVLAFHAYPARVPGGWCGVDAFFVLSGYLITRLLDAELQATRDIAVVRFYLRRGLRLAPAMLVLLAVCAVVATFAPGDQSAVAASILYGLFYVTNWALAFGIPVVSGADHLWSLAIEEQFYLVWPAVIRAAGSRMRPWLIGGLALAAIIWRVVLVLDDATWNRTYYGFDTHCDGLLFGCLLAVTPVSVRMRRLARHFVAVPLVYLAAFCLSVSWPAPWSQAFGSTSCAVASGWVLLVAEDRSRLARFLSWRPLRFTGRISYGLYLWHLPILVFGSMALPSGPLAGLLLGLAAYAAAVLSYVAVERPFLRLRSRLLAA